MIISKDRLRTYLNYKGIIDDVIETQAVQSKNNLFFIEVLTDCRHVILN